MSAPAQGTVYIQYIGSLLEEEKARREAIERRATGVVTVSSATVVLASTGVGVAAGAGLELNGVTTTAVVVALMGFLAAVVMAVLASQLKPYALADVVTLEAFLTSHWVDTETTARNNTGWLDVDTIRTLRAGNATKSWALHWSLRCQLGAVGALVVAVVVGVTTGSG